MKSTKCKIETLQRAEDSVSSFPAKALKGHNIIKKKSLLLLRCDNAMHTRVCAHTHTHTNTYTYIFFT